MFVTCRNPSHCLWISLVTLVGVLDAMVLERTFRDPFEHPLERMIQHKETGELYVGAVNNLFKLSADLVLLENAITGPADDNPKCPPPLLPCKEQKKSTNSHNQGLAFDYSQNSIIVCLSLFHGACHIRKLNNVSAVEDQMPKPIVSNHENSSTIFLTAPGPNGDDALYVASRYSNHGNKRYRGLVPSISSRNLQTLEFTHREASGSSKITVLSKYRTQHFVNPVYAFSHKEFVYFITTQPRSENPNSVHVTKLARVCQTDKKFESYVEVRLECRRGSKSYNLAQAGYLSTENNGQLYVAFAQGKMHSNEPTPYSAVCRFDMEEIVDKFEENIRYCHNGIGETGLHYLQHSKPCEKKTEPLQFCGPNFTPHASLDGRKPIISRPILEHSGSYFTAVASVLLETHTLLFLGTNTGYIYKVIVKDDGSTEIVEKLLVDQHRQILPDLIFTKDRTHLYLMTHDKVVLIDYADCNTKTTCNSCLTEGSPSCGWCIMEGKCSHRAQCAMSQVEPHWVSASNGSCLQILDVLPKELSLQNITSKAGVDQVRFKVDQMKAPPSSSNIGCLFLSGHSKEQTEALIQKNVIICPLPHHKNLPSIPKGEDNAEVNLEFQVDGKSIVKRSVKVFDCRVHKSCTLCTGSTFSCQWCPFSGTCIDSSSTCSGTNNIQGGRQVDISNPDKCPRLVNPDADIVVHSGTKKEVRVKVANLLPEQRKELKCHFEYRGLKKTVSAVVTNSNLVCHKTEFAYSDQEIPYVPVLFSVLWGNQSLPLDNPDNIQVRAYKCQLMVTNCGKCLSMDKEYDCVWCSNKCMLAGKCSGKVLKRSDTCPNPRILRFSPITGPIGGKTNITITGINLGKHEADLKDGVKVAGIKCKVLSRDYQPSSEFICETMVVDNAKTGTIKVKVAKKYSAESDSFFSYLTPSLREIVPKEGPKSGGTHVMIHGNHMNAGSRWDILIGSNPCEVISQNSSVIECVTAAEGSVTSADVSVSFGGLLLHLDEKFDFVEDPTITMVEPNRSILSGGTTLTVTGTNLNLIQEPKLFIKYNSTMKESPCKSKHLNTLECRMPSLDFGKGEVSITSPKEVQYGFIMDGVVQLKNLSDSPEFRPLLYFPDPVTERFNGEKNTKKYMKGDKLVIEGKFRSINQLLTDVYVHVGNSLCTDLKPHDTALMCTPPSSPSGVDKEGNAPVVLHIGQYKSDIGYLSYYEEQEGERPIALGIILGVALPMLTIIILLTVCVVRRHMKHDPSDNYIPDVLKDYEGKKENENDIGMNHMSAGTMDSAQYINELLASFDDEHERHQMSELLVTRNKLDIGELLGKGNFGVAYKSQFTKCDSEPPMTVTVKSLQGTNTDQKALQKFLKDSVIFKEMQHKNILPILGVCLTISDDPVVIVPYLETTDLRSHIRDSSKSLSVCTLLDHGLQVADGMAYLSDLKVIHHNLAARNCFLCDYKTVKITDIGLTNELFSKDFYFTEDHTAKLPVKWMAPESVEHFVFSIKTDVWSYGVVLWELLTRGVTPYPDVVPWDVHSYLQSGRRMQKPKHCPEFIYQLMLRCWQQQPDDRPTFSEICTTLRSVSDNDSTMAGDEAQPLNATVEFTGSTEYLEVIE